MVDVVAVVAVAGSSAVALVTVVGNVWTAAKQRAHDAQQGYEERVWERKSEVLPDLIGVALRLRRTVDPPEPDNRIPTHVANRLGADVLTALAELERLQPGVVAYASRETERALLDLIDAVYATGIETWLIGALEYVRSRTEQAMRDGDEVERTTWERNEGDIMRTLNEGMDLDAPRIGRLSTAVIEAAQESVRGR